MWPRRSGVCRRPGARVPSRPNGGLMYPELFRIPYFDWPISSFGAAMAVAFLVGYWIALPRMREEGLDPQHGADMLIWIMIGGVLGAKLYYATDFAVRGEADFFDSLFSRAGMTFYGGLMGGALAGILGCRYYQIPLTPFANAAATSVSIGQAIGRVGCFLVGDDYGKATDLPWGIAFPNGAPPVHYPVHPTQLYETFWLLGVTAFLWARRKSSPSVIGEFLILNGLGRTLIEHWRVNPRVALNMSEAQWIGIGLIVLGTILWFNAQAGTRRAELDDGSARALGAASQSGGPESRRSCKLLRARRARFARFVGLNQATESRQRRRRESGEFGLHVRRAGIDPILERGETGRVIAIEEGLHPLGVEQERLHFGTLRRIGGAAGSLAKRLPALDEIGALEQRASGFDETGRHVSVHRLEQAFEAFRERRGDRLASSEQEARHDPILRALDQHAAKLVARLRKENSDFGHDFVEACRALFENPLEFAKEFVVFLGGIAAQRCDPRCVDLLLVQALAQLHRFVKERADREVEERFAADGSVSMFAVVAEETVAPFLEAKQHGRPVILDERPHRRERDFFRRTSLEEGLPLCERLQVLAQELDEISSVIARKSHVPPLSPRRADVCAVNRPGRVPL